MNGWQRLFVLVSVLWGIVSASVFYWTPPDTSEQAPLNVDKYLVSLPFPREVCSASVPPPSDAAPESVPSVKIISLKNFSDEEIASYCRSNALSIHMALDIYERDFFMPDGAVVVADPRRKPEDVAAAYEKAKEERRGELQSQIFAHAPKRLGAFAAPLVLIYFLGWMVAWVRRGFHRHP